MMSSDKYVDDLWSWLAKSVALTVVVAIAGYFIVDESRFIVLTMLIGACVVLVIGVVVLMMSGGDE